MELQSLSHHLAALIYPKRIKLEIDRINYADPASIIPKEAKRQQVLMKRRLEQVFAIADET